MKKIKEVMNINEMSEAAKQARADYQRRWRNAHPDKAADYHRRYWERRAESETAENKEPTNERTNERND